MAHSRDYTRMLNSKRWKTLRLWKLEQNPLCEMCLAEGKFVAAVDVHHIQPCESARSIDEMKALCFNPDNLQALCIPHHIKVHQDVKSHSREAHKQREDERLERWKRKHDSKRKPPRLI